MTATHSCPNGHRWPTNSGKATCPACGSPPTETVDAVAATPTGIAPPRAAVPPPKPRPKSPTASTTDATLFPPGYEILGELGRGGMGVVYKARQTALNRVVALKMILTGGHASTKERARFRVEAQATAKLHHAGIVQVYEVGEHRDCPFLTLEFVDGGSLAGQVGDDPWPAKKAAALVARLARAMQHAHQAGIVHRDLKPGNVLLTADGKPKIGDFGLAKQLDSEQDLSRTGAVMGTPQYMAPEQALGKVHDIGPATDVYALGAMLYELLTGRPPIMGPTAAITVGLVPIHEPEPPRKLVSDIPRDLETICLRCLRKESDKRYPEAGELADDLARFGRGEPIRARRVGMLERGWRWCRRNPLAASVMTGINLALIVFTCLAAWFALKAINTNRDARRDFEANESRRNEAEAVARQKTENEQAALATADKERERAERAEERANQATKDADQQKARADLEKARADQAEMRADAERERAAAALRRLSMEGTLFGRHDEGLVGVSFSPEGKRLASASLDGTVKVWDVARAQELLSLKGKTGGVWSVCFSPDGKRIVSGGEDFVVKVRDAATGEELLVLKGHTSVVSTVVCSPDGERLASASYDGTVKVWDAATGEELLTINQYSAVLSVVFSPDGNRLAGGGGGVDHAVRVWDAATGKELLALKGHTGIVHSVVYSPDGKRLASSSEDQTVKVWDATTGQDLLTLKGHTDYVKSVVFSPDGKSLASGGDKTVRVWDAANGQNLVTLKGHTDRVGHVCFSPDGKRLVAGSQDHTIKLWDVPAGP